MNSRWARKLIHSHVWALDEQKCWYIRTFDFSMRENINTFTLLSSRWAKTVIHSRAWAFDVRKRWYIRIVERRMQTYTLWAFSAHHSDFPIALHTSISLSNRLRKSRFSFKLSPPPSQRPKPSKTLRHSRFSYADRTKYENTADCPDHPGGERGGPDPLKRDGK